jgi:succinate dehydrogenase/fumarate reductase-like Fe-S protein
LSPGDWREAELLPLRDFAVTVHLVVDLHRWSDNEKQGLVRVIRAKAGADESSYLQLMQKHARLREALIRLGS